MLIIASDPKKYQKKCYLLLLLLKRVIPQFLYKVELNSQLLLPTEIKFLLVLHIIAGNSHNPLR